jgi:peptidyl-prolyl cis-trans isomerase D
MFNLFRSREKTVRYLLSGLLGLVALSMVTYLIPQTNTGTNSADPTVVATVGNRDITALQINQAVQNVTRNRQMPPELLGIYAPQIVQQMINEHAMDYEARRLHIQVSPEEVDNALVDQMPPQAVKDGKVDPATLGAMLQQQGTTLGKLKEDTMRQLRINRLEQVVTGGTVVTPEEIEAEFHKRNDKVKLEYVVVTPAKFQSQAEPTDAEVKAYFEAHKATFQIPEKRNIAFVTIDPEKVSSSLNITDAQVLADYNSRKNDFQVPERVKARHILLKTEGANDAAVKTKAEALLKQVKGGGDFAKLAKENSADPGSATQGGELGYLTRGQTVPEFEKSAFSLKPGEISDLVKTQYGYHIIQSEEHQTPQIQPFESVKNQILLEMRQKAANQMMEKVADQVVDALRKDPSHPEKAAAIAGTTVQTAENVQSGEPIPGIGVSKELDTAIFSLKKGEAMAGPVGIANGRAVVAVVTDIIPAHQADFSEAMADARNKAREEKLDKIVADKLAELSKKTTELNGDLEKAAKGLGLEVKTSAEVDRNTAIEGLGTPSTFPDAMTKPVGSVIGPVTTAGGKAMLKVLERIPANGALIAAQTAAIRTELKQAKQRDRATLFQDGLRQRLQAEGKLKIKQDAIDRIIASFRTRT